jgi:tetratricopeptide (TPR) repeat protein
MSASPQPGAVTRSSLAQYLRAEPVLLALLFVLVVVFFLAVTGLSRLYHAQQESLANRWFKRGVSDLNSHNFDAAALDFRTALRYSRDNYSYQLNLAEALIGSKRTPEAQAYLANLFDREPENGVVNLELARIAAQNNDPEHALRYYHNAIYATWSNDTGDDLKKRREARIELVEYLLKSNATTQAQAELIALAASLGDEPEQQRQLGDLFVRAQDYEHALAAYRFSLKGNRHNPGTEAGAGLAAFRLAQYRVASRYLQAAIAGDPADAKSAALLKTTELVLQLDPYENGIRAAQRDQIVRRDFEIAGDRLKACGLSAGAAGPISSLGTSQRTLGDSWTQLKAHVTERGLERNPDLADSVMNLVFEIERQTATNCGTPTEADEALLLISKSREGR